MAEHRIPKAFDGTREHMITSNMPNIAYPGQHIDIKIPEGLRDNVIVPVPLK